MSPAEQGGAPVSAVCGGCGKRYRVPAADRAYPCKACGGEVRAEAPRPIELEGETCKRCSAFNPSGTRFCLECGASLKTGETPEEKRLRVEATTELGKAYKTIRALRALYTGLALISGLIALLQGVGLDTSDTREVVIFGALVFNTAFLVCGAILSARQPFFWGVLLASIQTLLVALQLLSGNFARVPIALAVALWVIVVPTVRLRKLLEQFPDLYVARKLQGKATLSSRQVARSERRTASTAAGDRAFGLRVVGIALGLAALIFGGYALATRPPSLGDAPKRFARLWNEHGPVGVGRLYAEQEREQREATFRRVAHDQGWELEAPDVSPGEVVENEDGTRSVAFEGAAGTLHTRWELRDGEWVLSELRTPYEGGLERLREAWNRSDISAVAAFFHRPERLERSLRRVVDRNAWTDAFPQLGAPEVVQESSKTVRVHYSSELGPLKATWRFEGDRWALSSIDPPDPE